MKKVFCMMIVLVLILGCSTNLTRVEALTMDELVGTVTEDATHRTVSLEDSFEEDTVIVVLTNTESLSFKNYGPEDFPEISCISVAEVAPYTMAATEDTMAELETATRMGTVTAGTLSTNAALSSMVSEVNSFNRILTLTLAEPGKQQVLDAIAALNTREDVLYAQPNYIMELNATGSNDAYFFHQTALSAANVPAAWDYTTGSSGVYVGVLDSGVDVTHIDMSTRVNTTLSRDFVGDDYSATEDPIGHGTKVAGIIGAQGNNEVGIAGVSWNATLVSLRVANTAGYVNSVRACSAVDYAADTLRTADPDIRILNMSFSLSKVESSKDTTNNWDVFYAQAKAYGALGGLIVCAAGNKGLNTDNSSYTTYPACFTKDLGCIIAVGALNSSGSIKSDSNYGSTSVDIFAPGENILTCYPKSRCTAKTCDSASHLANGYHYMSQTSAAAPMVAGVAALMLSVNPNLTGAQIKEILIFEAAYSSGLDGKCVSDGKLDAYAAVTEAYNQYYTR